MIEGQSLIETDRFITLALNGSDSLFLDGIISMFTSMGTWIAVALVSLFIIFRNNTTKNMILIYILLAITVICCDQLSSSVFKPLFERYRPSQDPNILNLIDTVNGYRGGQFGFFSSHAANSFGIVVFLMWLIKDFRFGIIVTVWALINSFSRIYLGVHFVGDVLTGIIVGIFFGTIFYWLYRFIIRNERQPRFSTELYTSSGYLLKDISLFRLTLYATYLFILFYVCIVQSITPY
jgi:undecaprenyl-diphosphatase